MSTNPISEEGSTQSSLTHLDFQNAYQYAVVGTKFTSAGQRIAYARFSSDLLAQLPISIMGEMVLSGSLTQCKEEAMEFPYSFIKSGLVSESEALEGPDTFLGCSVVYISTSNIGARTLRYGMVVDTEWIPTQGMARFYILHADSMSPEVIVSPTSSLRVVSLVNYCFQLFKGKHVAAYRWHAIDEMHDRLSRCWSEIPPTARLGSADVRLKFISDTLSIWPSDSSKLAFFSLSSDSFGSVTWSPIEQLLEYDFYTTHGRTAPKELTIMTSPFLPIKRDDAPREPAFKKSKATKLRDTAKPRSSTPTKRKSGRTVTFDFSDTASATNDDGSSDEDMTSDHVPNTLDSTEPAPIFHGPTPTPGPLPTNTVKIPLTSNTLKFSMPHPDIPTGSSDIPANQREAVSQNENISTNPGQAFARFVDLMGSVTNAAQAASKDKDIRTVKMTASQLNIFNKISNGMCASGGPFVSPQILFDNMQTTWWRFGICFHPVLCMGFFSFDFGRGCLISEFMPEDWVKVQARAEAFEAMDNFSAKAKRLPMPRHLAITCFNDLLSCLNMVIKLTKLLFQQFMVEVLEFMYGFLSDQSRRHLKPSTTLMDHVVRWTNNRLFALRCAVAISDPSAIQIVIDSFHSKAQEWSDIMEVGLQHETANLRSEAITIKAELASLKSAMASKSFNRPQSEGRRQKHGAKKDAKMPDNSKAPFRTITDGIPAHKGKRVCYHNLSAKGCPTGEAECLQKRYCHYIPKPDDIDAPTRAAFVQHFGPFRSELATKIESG